MFIVLDDNEICSFLGTIGFENDKGVVPNQAYLYKITRDNLANPVKVLSGITNSNGIAWNKNNNKMYYIDTPTLKIVEFEFDEETGSISSKYMYGWGIV